MRKTKILVVGSLNTDFVIRTPKIPIRGETLLGNSFQRHFGGKGANQAVAIARQGVQTYLAGCIGQDAFGREQLASLEREGIDTSNIKEVTQESSGVAFILLDSLGGNRIIVVPGANGMVNKNDINALGPLLAKCTTLVLQLEIPLKAVLQAVEMASSLGVKVILNPAPAQALPDHIFPKLSIITPNETEAQILTGVEITNQLTAEKAGELLLNKGVGTVVITLGAHGVYVIDEQERFYLPAHKVKVVDTVAAGDTFTGVLAAEVSRGSKLSQAVRHANAAAALAVTRPGAQPSIPSRQEVIDFLIKD